jgi:hypothetical protein
MSLQPRILVLAALAAAAACSDAVAPERPPETPAIGDLLRAYDCQVTVATQDVACAERAPGPANAPRLIIGGSNGQFVLLASSNFVGTPDSVSIDVTIQNRIVQAMGTVDGVTAHVDGIRIFFETGPAGVPADPGLPSSVSVGNPDGYRFFLEPEQPYFQYAGLLSHLQTSVARRWRFDLENVASFQFTVLVVTQVQYPQGWVEITPDAPSLAVSDVDSLLARVRNAYGQGQQEEVDWTSSNTGVVTATALTDSTAEITGISAGTAWIRAVSTFSSARRDSVLVTVN